MITVLSRKLACALALGGLTLTAATAPALAAPRGGSYAATLAAPLAEPRQDIINGNVWKCADTRCTARADGGRALFVCQNLVRKVGPVASFTAPQGALSDDEIARCNGG